MKSLWRIGLVVALTCILAATGCSDKSDDVVNQGDGLSTKNCVFSDDGFGASGETALQVEEVVSGLEVPWALGFISENRFLVTERPGRIRIVSNGKLAEEPVATVSVGEAGEGGLLGLAM